MEDVIRKEIHLTKDQASALTKLGKPFKLKLKPYIEKLLSDYLIKKKAKNS